jgi:hypothetical protein
VNDGDGIPRSLAGRGAYELRQSWRELPDGEIEFTMRRLKSAD